MKRNWILLWATLFIFTPATLWAVPKGSVSAPQAEQRLIEGNQRFSAGKPINPSKTATERQALVQGQSPFASVLSCSDSRVPPELVFDQDLGDLFVVRVAGNTADKVAIGSLEYGYKILGSALILVLGHEECGAIKATIKNAPVPGHITDVVKAIEPALKNLECPSGQTLECSVRANVLAVVKQLRSSSPILAEALKAGKLKVIGGIYDLDSGQVEIID